MAEKTFSTQNFEAEVLQSDVPVLVDFYADWCGPCKIQGPIVDELAKIYEAKPVKIGKLNVDESPEIAGRYNVLGIPTILIFKNGQVASQLVGVQDKKVLAEALEATLV